MAFPTPELLLTWCDEYERALRKLGLESPLRAELRSRIQRLQRAYFELQGADPESADAAARAIAGLAAPAEGVIIGLPRRKLTSASTRPGHAEADRPESRTG